MSDSQKPTRYWVPEDYLFSDAAHSMKAFPEQAASWMIGANDYDQLMQQAQNMALALSVYAMTNETFPEYSDVARQALKQFYEFMKDQK